MIKKLKFYFKKMIKDITSPLKYMINDEDNTSTELNKYYFDFKEEELLLGGSQDFHFDSNNIPIIPTYIDVDEDRFHYYPISIAQYGLAIFNTYVSTRTEKDKKRFINIVNWFSNNQDDDGWWYADVPEPKFNLLPPWKSAMAQGRGLSILLRGYQLTGNRKYLQKANKALATFNVKVGNGGILSIFGTNSFYEEYPSKPYPHVLNGMIFALLGVFDYIRVNKESGLAKAIFERGIKSVIAMLPLYDLGYWTSYDLYHITKKKIVINTATAHYHNIHIKQLLVLYELTNNIVFKDYADKWSKYENFLNLIRAYGLKFLTIIKR